MVFGFAFDLVLSKSIEISTNTETAMLSSLGPDDDGGVGDVDDDDIDWEDESNDEYDDFHDYDGFKRDAGNIMKSDGGNSDNVNCNSNNSN